MKRALLALALMATPLRMLLGAAPGPLVDNPALLALINGQSGAGDYAIGLTSKAVGSSWIRYAFNPILEKGAPGAWNDDHVKDPCIFHDGTQFVIYASGHDGTTYRIGRWTAPDLAALEAGDLTPDAGNPIISVSAATFRSNGVIFPTVLYEPADTGKEEKIWFTGLATDGKYRIGYAYRNAGTGVVTVVGQVVDVGAGGTWEDEGVVSGAVLKVEGTYNLFYGGMQGTSVNRFQGGLVTCTDPEDTYTKSGSNPVMLARFNDAGTAPLLTANLNAGTKVVTIADTSPFNVNEPVAFADTDTAGVGEIDTIDSGTQITLKVNVTGTITNGGDGAFRPLAYNSVQPRTVRAAFGGGYEAFVTIFQPVQDLSTSGTTLWEGSMRMTAADLDGPWDYDYETGLMFALAPVGEGNWDDQSAENPSVIALP